MCICAAVVAGDDDAAVVDHGRGGHALNVGLKVGRGEGAGPHLGAEDLQRKKTILSHFCVFLDFHLDFSLFLFLSPSFFLYLPFFVSLSLSLSLILSLSVSFSFSFILFF